MSDIEIIEAVKSGNRDRYSELVERHQKMVYGIAWSRLGDAGLCEDAAQETFVKAFCYLAALRNPGKFPMWLARIARNVSNSVLRKRKRELDKCQRWRMESPIEYAAKLPSDEEPSIGQTLTQTLSSLPEQHRECLVLFYLEGKNVREAAERLGISETAMKTRLHRARVALRGRLEEELKSSLSELGPRAGFSAGVMPLLPAMPWATAGIGGTSTTLGLGVKSLLPLSLFFWMSLIQGAFSAALFGWLGKLEAANLAEGPNQGLRKKLIRGNVVVLAMGVVLVYLFALTTLGRLGQADYFKLLALFCLWGTYSAARMLRVNRSPFAIGMVLANAAFLLTFVLIGFFHAPFWTFFAMMLPLNVVLYHTNKSRPMRHDYNLFLRQTEGLFGALTLAPEKPERLTRTQLCSFIRFLGARFLVRDYRFDDTGVTLFLPSVKAGIEQFLSYTSANSSMRVNFDGLIDAHLGAKDLRSLHSLADGAMLQKEVLEQEVAKVVDHALAFFLVGQPERTEAVLQAETEDQIFRTSTAKSREHRIRGGLAIVTAVVLLLIFNLWIRKPGVLNYQPPRPVSQAMAQEAIATWCREYHSGHPDFMGLMNAEKHPPLDFIGAENEAAYRRTVAQILIAGCGDSTFTRVYSNLNSPNRLYHVIENRILTRDELAELGLSSENMRVVLTNGGPTLLQEISRGSMIVTTDAGTFTMPDVDTNAYRLACLKAFGCLDFVDGDGIAAEMAAKQVSRNWQAPAGYAPVDIEKAAGLFDFGVCDLRSTRGALWSLQILGKLDLVDQEACVQGILRFYQGKGRFKADFHKEGIHIHGDEEDTFFAMESLAILDAFDRIPDPWKWRFEPKTSAREWHGEKRYGLVTFAALRSWAYQLRLEELRGG